MPKQKLSVQSIIFFVSSVVAYLFPIFPSKDLQPWPLLVALIILCIYKNKLALYSTRNIVLSSLALILYPFFEFVFSNTLGSSNFATFWKLSSSIIAIDIFLIVIINSKIMINYRIVLIVLAAYYIISMLELAVGADFLSSLISLIRAEDFGPRGVAGLTPEPDMFGRQLICILFLLMLMYLLKAITLNQLRFTITLISIMIIFFSKAATSTFLLIATVILFSPIIFKEKKYIELILIFVILLILTAGVYIIPDSRVFSVIGSAFNSSEYLLSQGGFVMRLFNPIISFEVGLINNFPFGHGVLSAEEISYPTFVGKFIDDFKNGYNAPTAHGGLSGLIYNYGVIAIPFIYFIYREVFKVFKKIEIEYGNNLSIRMMLIFTLIYFFDSSLFEPLRLFLLCFILWSSSHYQPSMKKI